MRGTRGGGAEYVETLSARTREENCLNCSITLYDQRNVMLWKMEVIKNKAEWELKLYCNGKYNERHLMASCI